MGGEQGVEGEKETEVQKFRSNKSPNARSGQWECSAERAFKRELLFSSRALRQKGSLKRIGSFLTRYFPPFGLSCVILRTAWHAFRTEPCHAGTRSSINYRRYVRREVCSVDHKIHDVDLRVPLLAHRVRNSRPCVVVSPFDIVDFNRFSVNDIRTF